MMDFLYTGEVNADALRSDNIVLGILDAAHRYNIPTLEELCVEALTAIINVEVASEWFHLADLIGNPSFRTRCLKFIREHIAEVQGSETYKEFIVKRPSLLPPVKRQRTDACCRERRTDSS